MPKKTGSFKDSTGKILKYEYHIHEGNWVLLKDYHLYKEPFTASAKVTSTTLKADPNKTYRSSYKATNEYQNDWYYIKTPSGSGWIPYLSKGAKLVTRKGAIISCEIDDDKKREENIKNSILTPKSNKKVPKITELYDFSTKNIEYTDFLRAHMMLPDDAKNWNSKFNRMQFVNPFNIVGNTREYLFFTRPDLNLLDLSSDGGLIKLNPELGNDAYWLEMLDMYLPEMAQLQKSSKGLKGDPFKFSSPFIPMLSNADIGSLDLPSTTLNTTETGQTIYGTNIMYAQSGFKADEEIDFSTEFIDNQHLSMTQFFKMWNIYESLKSEGIVSPPSFSSTRKGKKWKSLNGYTVNKILHDQIGVFKFIVDDMENIIHYSYFCGCFPKNYPRDIFRDIEAGHIKFSVDWRAQFFMDMNPLILLHFENLTRPYINKMKQISMWDNNLQLIPGDWADCPGVYADNNVPNHPGNRRYKLLWYKK